MNSSNLKYYSQIDGLRCFAIISVMIGHWISWDTTNIILKNTPWGHGVILFFVLSGYLITNILLELKEKINTGVISHSEGLKTFYFRRILRIFPIYYLLIFYLFYINYENTREVFPWLVTYTSNILQSKTGSFIGGFNHFWSLAVEEQFYLIWPFIILFVDLRKLINVILIFIIISFLSRLSCVIINPNNWMLSAYLTPNLFLPLCLGALLAFGKRYKPYLESFFNNSIYMYASILLYVFSFYFFHYRWRIALFDLLLDEYLFAIMCTFIISKTSSNSFRFIVKYILEHDVVVYTGKISYGLYVYHLFVIGFFWNYLALEYKLGVVDKHAMWFIYFVLAYILAILSYYVIEKPFNNLKQYFKY